MGRKIFSPRPGYDKIRAYEPLAFWLLLEATYGLGIKLVKALAEGKKVFQIGSNKELTISSSKKRLK